MASTASTLSSQSRKRGVRGAAIAFVAYVVLTVAYTWPVVGDIGRSTTPINDTLSHAWGISWVARQVLQDPWHLYDSNMFWPHPASLAFTDPMIAQGLSAVPLRLLGASPLLTHNLVLLSTFPLAALGAYLLAFDLTRSRSAAFLAGLVFAFSAFRFNLFAQVNVLSVQWLPWVVFFFRRSALKPTPRRLLGLMAVSTLLALSSGYYAVLLALTLCVCGLAEVRTLWRRRSLLPVFATLFLAASACIVVSLPQIAIRGSEVRTNWGRGAQEHWSARPASYLNPGLGISLPHLDWLRRHMAAPGPLFAGSAALGLAALGLGWRGERRRLALFLALTGVLLSFGPRIVVLGMSIPGPFDWLRRLPIVDMLRTPARLGVLAHLGIALLTAHGAARLDVRRAGRVLLAFLVALQLVESYPGALAGQIRRAPPLPPSSRWLETAPRAPVLELPWSSNAEAGVYLYWSTRHWQPLVNGLGTFQPPGNLGLAKLAARFPSPSAARLLRGEGIRYVVIHTDRLSPVRRRRALASAAPAGVSLFRLGKDLVFEIAPEGETEARPPKPTVRPPRSNRRGR